MAESFEEFKDSFSYGSRTDLSFKFLKGLTEEEAGDFLALLFSEVGELFDGGTPERLIDLVYEWQVKAYQPSPGAKRPYVYEDRPFQPLTGELSETTVGLVTSSGHFSADDPPSDSRAELGQDEITSQVSEFLRMAPELSEISTDASIDELVVRHPGYDTRSVARDPGVAFPTTALGEAASDGRLGSLAPTAYSFVGACSQGRLRQELDNWIPAWKSAGIEALFLVPV